MYPGLAQSTKLLIQAVAQRDHELAEKLSKDWDKGRDPDSAAKREFLALHPERFHQLLQGKVERISALKT